MSSFYLDHGTWAFAVRKWLDTVKFWLIKQVASALGYTSLARKVWAGWQVCLSGCSQPPVDCAVHCGLRRLAREANQSTPAPHKLSARNVGYARRPSLSPGLASDSICRAPCRSLRASPLDICHACNRDGRCHTLSMHH